MELKKTRKFVGILAIALLVANLVLFPILKYDVLKFWLIIIIVGLGALGLFKLFSIIEKK